MSPPPLQKKGKLRFDMSMIDGDQICSLLMFIADIVHQIGNSSRKVTAVWSYWECINTYSMCDTTNSEQYIASAPFSLN